MATTYIYHTLADSAQTGPLVGGLNVGTAAQLAFDYATNYPAFLTTAEALVNQTILAAESNEPEETRNLCVIGGWGSAVPSLVSSINQQWQAGKVVGADGNPVPAWPDPGYSGQIAWNGGNGQIVLRWVKGQPQLYILLAILIVLAGAALYYVLTQAPWKLQSATPQTLSNPNGTPILGNTPLFGGTPFRVFYLPWYDAAAAAAALAVSPWAYRQIVNLKNDRVDSVRANRALHDALEED